MEGLPNDGYASLSLQQNNALRASEKPRLKTYTNHKLKRALKHFLLSCEFVKRKLATDAIRGACIRHNEPKNGFLGVL